MVAIFVKIKRTIAKSVNSVTNGSEFVISPLLF